MFAPRLVFDAPATIHGWVMAVEELSPKVGDRLCGVPLSDERWNAARARETESLANFGVYEPLTAAEARREIESGAQVVNTRWLHVVKSVDEESGLSSHSGGDLGPNALFKARLCCQDFKRGNDHGDSDAFKHYSGVPAMPAIRTAMSLAIHGEREQGVRWEMTLADVSTAFLHTPLDDRVITPVPAGLSGVLSLALA